MKKKIALYILGGLAVAVLFCVLIVAALGAITTGILGIVQMSEILVDAIGAEAAAALVMNAAMCVVFVLVAVLLFKALVNGSNLVFGRSTVPQPTGSTARAVAIAARDSRLDLSRTYGHDVARLALNDAAGGAYEEAQPLAAELDEQIRAGRRTRPSEGVKRHEAAHAVVATDLGYTLTEIRIAPISGHISAPGISLPLTADDRWNALAVFAAGATVYTGHGYENDLSRAASLTAAMIISGERPAGYSGPLTADGLLVGARDRVREILTRRAATYDRILAALQSRGEEYFTIRGAELNELLDEHLAVTRTDEALVVA